MNSLALLCDENAPRVVTKTETYLVFVQPSEFTYKTGIWIFPRDGGSVGYEGVLAQESKGDERRGCQRELEEGIARWHMCYIGPPHRKDLIVFVNLRVWSAKPTLGVGSETDRIAKVPSQ